MSSIDTNIQQMQQAAQQQAALMTASIEVTTATTNSSTAAHTVNGMSAAGGEVGKSFGNDVRQSAKSS